MAKKIADKDRIDAHEVSSQESTGLRRVTRRDFIRSAAGAFGALTLGGPFIDLLFGSSPKAMAAPISIGKPGGGGDSPLGRPYLLLDSRNVSETSNVSLALGKVVKHPSNPLFEPDRPWEGNYDNFYGNVAYAEESREFKIWYLNMMKGKSSLLYARSDDGIHWEKPTLGIHEFNGSEKNNIVLLRAHGAGVFRDDRDPDPTRRYKMISLDEQNDCLQVGFSSAGIFWSDQVLQRRISATADTHNNALWAPTLNRYVAFTRQWSLWPYNDRSFDPPEEMLPARHERLPDDHELLRKGVRQVARTETLSADDFTSFGRAEVVMEGVDAFHQTYAMPVFYYEGIYLGLVAIYEDYRSHRVFAELAWSPDTEKWYRICPGVPLIPNGNRGEYDFGMIWGCASPIVRRNGEILIYYGGFDLPHGADGRTGSLCLATLKRDRWAGYEVRCGCGEGTVVTAPIRWQGRSLWVNADAAGCVWAELLDARGNVIDGYSAAESKLIAGDHIKAQVTWTDKQDLSELTGKEIKIRWYIRDATIYAFGADAE